MNNLKFYRIIAVTKLANIAEKLKFKSMFYNRFFSIRYIQVMMRKRNKIKNQFLA